MTTKNTNHRNVMQIHLLPFLATCLLWGCFSTTSEPIEFEDEEHDVYVRHVVQTMERMNVPSVENITCEELCYTVDGMNTNEYNITECSINIDTTIFTGEASELDGSILAGTVTCSGSVLFYEK